MRGDNQWFFVVLATLGLYFLVRAEIAQHSVWPVVLGAVLLFFLASLLFPAGTGTVTFRTFGEVGYVQVSSPALEERIQARYQSEIDELSRLGFCHRISIGQTFPILSLIMIFPAIVLLVMCWKREVITLRGGREFLIGHAIYASEDKTTFAEPIGLGIIFHTQFQYGAILTSTNYESNRVLGTRFERHVYEGASISDTWAAHQRSVQQRLAKGAEIDRDMSFRAFVGINN
jgi:hypothetical protein